MPEFRSVVARGAGLALLLAAATAAPARADETLRALVEPTPVDAWGGRIVWSEYDLEAERYRLMTATAQQTAVPVAVEPQAVPFDVDLGPARGGSMLAAYSRCAGGTAGGCDLYTFDFTTGRERKLARVSTDSADERMPSVWHGRVAYVRDGRQGRAKIYVKPLAGGRATRIRRGPDGAAGPGYPTALELNGRRLAFVWEVDELERLTDRLFLQRLGGRRRLVDRAASGALSLVKMLRPNFEGGALVYAISRRLAAGNRFLRYDLSSRRIRKAVSRDGIVAAAFDAGRFLYVLRSSTCTDGEPDDGASPSPCLLRRTAPIRFR